MHVAITLIKPGQIVRISGKGASTDVVALVNVARKGEDTVTIRGGVVRINDGPAVASEAFTFYPHKYDSVMIE